MKSQKRILITGVTGFIGSHLARELVQKGYHVIGITRSGNTKNISSILKKNNFELIQADLSEKFAFFPESADVIIHAAAQPMRFGTEEDYRKNNVTASANIIEYARKAGAGKFIFLSSISVYGDVKEKTIDESTPINNPHSYGRTKLEVERLLEENKNNFATVVLRLPGVVGKGAENAWLAAVLDSALKNREIKIYGPKEKFNNVVHIADLCTLVEKIIESEAMGFEVVTLGCSGPMGIENAVKLIVEKTKSKSKITEEKSGKNSFTISYAKAKKLFEYEPMKLSDILEKYAAESSGKL